MRSLALASLLLAVTALGQTDAKPDYSPDALRHVLTASDDDRPPSPHSVHWGFGGVEFRAFNMNWRVMFLPFNAPFSGSVRGPDPSSMWPDPFALTGATFAETPRTWQDKREMNKERKRIESFAKVQAKP
jgi:hypothetical protein